jgi:co-chaperonin GroES (HSP10)
MRPVGAWVLLKVDKPVEKTPGGIYMPAGNMVERLGHATATVLAVGSGKWDAKKKKRIESGLKPGDRVVFRGYLQEAQRPQVFDDDLCLIHQDDVPLTLEEE